MPKKKIHPPKQIFIGCEGANELQFLLYLQELYHPRGGNFRIKSEDMRGTSPDMIVRKISWKGYENRYVWLDIDRPEIVRARIMAKKENIILFESSPSNLNGEILRMLGHKMGGISDYKKEFARLYEKIDLLEKKSYIKLFPFELLEILRQNDEFIISKIIKLLETGEL